MWSKSGQLRTQRIINASAIVTCKSRLRFIKQTLPIIKSMFAEYVLVDWSCPEFSGEWAGKHGAKVNFVKGMIKFNQSAARNAGVSLATYEWLFFIDADIVLTDNIHNHIDLNQRNIFYAFEKDHCQGSILCRREDHKKIGGFNESFKHYGFEDIEFRQRMRHNKLKEIILPPSVVYHMDHSNVLRTLHYDIKDIWQSNFLNITKHNKT